MVLSGIQYFPFFVIPAKAGIQLFPFFVMPVQTGIQYLLIFLVPGLRREDEEVPHYLFLDSG